MKLSKEQAEKTAVKLSDRIETVFKEKNCEKWLEMFISEDTLVVEAQTLWFKGLIQKKDLLTLTYSMESHEYSGDEIIINCILKFDFRSYDRLIERYEYTFDMADGLWKIAWLEKLPVSYDENNSSEYKKFDFSGFRNNSDTGAFRSKNILAELEKSNDPLSPNYYLRAVGRSIRFREAHPVLECASLLSSMMSSSVIELARQVIDTERLTSAKNLFHASIGRLKVQLVREDRDNTWVSKFTAPFLGIEELYYLKGENEAISGNCNCIMSVYYAILRLCGFDKADILQVRFHNHDAILFLSDGHPYYLSTDELKPARKNTLFHFSEITKAFNEDFVCSLNGNHYLEHHVNPQVMQKFIDKFTCFVFLENKINLKEVSGNGSGDSVLKDIMLYDNEELTEVIQEKIYTRILSAGIKDPDSSYVWAKYAFQSLYVPMPRVYLSWSLQSPVFMEYCKKVTQLEQCIRQLEQLDTFSIFKEEDRIMTADQVLRHKCADRKSKALFLHSWITLVQKTESYFLAIESEFYCVWNEEGKHVFWNPTDNCKYSAPIGKVMLVFDKNHDYYPAVCREDEKEMIPGWLAGYIK